LENNLRPLKGGYWVLRSGRSGPFGPLLAAFGTPFRGTSRFSKQFRKGYPPKFALTAFSKKFGAGGLDVGIAPCLSGIVNVIGRGLEARPLEYGCPLEGRTEPVAQPATAEEVRP
jgi:hypothetical protein